MVVQLQDVFLFRHALRGTAPFHTRKKGHLKCHFKTLFETAYKTAFKTALSQGRRRHHLGQRRLDAGDEVLLHLPHHRREGDPRPPPDQAVPRPGQEGLRQVPGEQSEIRVQGVREEQGREGDGHLGRSEVGILLNSIPCIPPPKKKC